MARRYKGEWTKPELSLVVAHYATHGPKGLAPLLPGRSRKAIGLKAHDLGLSRPYLARNKAQEVVPLTPMPTMTDDEREACRFFRAWRYQPEPGVLRWAA